MDLQHQKTDCNCFNLQINHVCLMGIHKHRMLEDENETTPIDANDDGEAGAVNVDNDANASVRNTQI